MNVCLLALWSDSLTYTIAKALAFDGHQVRVWIADVERDGQSSWSLSGRIAAIPGVVVVADAAARPPARVDRLIVQGHPQLLQYRPLLDLLAPTAAAITAVSYGDRNRPYRQALRMQWRERRWYGRWFARVTRIAYKDGFYPLDLLGLFRSRRVVGFDAHSKFLQDVALFQAIHAQDWEVDAPRPMLANFLGSRDPAARERILDSVRACFEPPASTLLARDPPKTMYWRAYSDAEPAAVGAEEFIDVLTHSDFTLAPPGYSLVTHRPVEALLRGGIPVLNADELDLYDLDLVDGVNCIAVPPGGWPAAMARIIAMPESEIVAMRRNIRALVQSRVDYPALARDIGQRLGIDGARA